MLLTLSIIIALMADFIVGEPRRWHPLAGFGNAASWLESKLNVVGKKSDILSRVLGLVAWITLVSPIVILLWMLKNEVLSPQTDFIIGVVCLSFSIGANSLVQHASAVTQALKDDNFVLARQRLAMIVSRDTSNSNENAINSATIESVLENGSDAIFAAIFWFVLLGAPGVLLYRFSNTLDAMWGYRTERFHSFGWAAARIDDLLNWAPARLTALSYALAGNISSALFCWRKQASLCQGINPGVVMASGAGALNIQIGGAAVYHGKKVERPNLGCGNRPKVFDIERAIQLVNKSIIIWLLIIALGEYLLV